METYGQTQAARMALLFSWIECQGRQLVKQDMHLQKCTGVARTLSGKLAIEF